MRCDNRYAKADLSDPNAAGDLVKQVRSELRPVTAIHWNADADIGGDVLTADAAALRAVFDVSVTSPVFAVQEALADLKAAKGAMLVTNGGLGLFDPQIDAMAVQWNSMGLAIANSAKHKLAGLLSQKLRGYGITVGEVAILGLVKGTVWDAGNATIEPGAVAGKFREILLPAGIEKHYRVVICRSLTAPAARPVPRARTPNCGYE
jgi:NAD(P)-dependent dehydrogenase (short-subunit alcohol dehydrogenase family)